MTVTTEPHSSTTVQDRVPGSLENNIYSFRAPGSGPHTEVPGPSQEAFQDLAHDFRNVLSAMTLYSDLLGQPGVLTRRYAHYAEHLRLVVESGSSLIKQMASQYAGGEGTSALAPDAARRSSSAEPTLSNKRLGDPGAEVERLRGTLSTMLWPAIALELECLPCPGVIRLSADDLGRILVNLVRNAAEAMPGGGRVRITLQRGGGASFLPRSKLNAVRRPSRNAAVPGVLAHVGHELVAKSHTRDGNNVLLLCVQDNGPGIDSIRLQRIFDRGYTSKGRFASADLGSGMRTAPLCPEPGQSGRGLGLGIVRSLVEAAGGEIRVVSKPGSGTRFEMEFPLWTVQSAALPMPEVAKSGHENHGKEMPKHLDKNQQNGSRVQC